jgi:hypothetical protein
VILLTTEGLGESQTRLSVKHRVLANQPGYSIVKDDELQRLVKPAPMIRMIVSTGRRVVRLAIPSKGHGNESMSHQNSGTERKSTTDFLPAPCTVIPQRCKAR